MNDHVVDIYQIGKFIPLECSYLVLTFDARVVCFAMEGDQCLEMFLKCLVSLVLRY